MTSSKKQSYFLIVVLAIIWGSSFILMKRALITYTPFQIGALRILIAFLSMLPIILKQFRTIEKSKWKYLAASGFLGNGIPSILFPLAETRISSALAGMINTLTPIFTFIVGILIFGMKGGVLRILGLAIGLLGAIIMIAGDTGDLVFTEVNNYALIVVLAAVCYAFSVNILRYKLHDIDPVRLTAFALFFAGIPMGIILFSGDFVERTVMMPGSELSIFYIGILGLLSTALSTIIFNKIIKSSGALAASSVTYLIPVVAVLWGMFDDERLGLFHLLGLAAILTGVYLINRKK